MLTRGAKHPGGLAVPAIRVGTGGHRGGGGKNLGGIGQLPPRAEFPGQDCPVTAQPEHLAAWAESGKPVVALIPEFDDYLQPAEARERFERAVFMDDVPLPPLAIDLRVIALTYLALTLVHQGNPDQGRARLREAKERAALGRPFDQASPRRFPATSTRCCAT